MLQAASSETPEVSTGKLRPILAANSAAVFDSRPYREDAVSRISEALPVSGRIVPNLHCLLTPQPASNSP